MKYQALCSMGLLTAHLLNANECCQPTDQCCEPTFQVSLCDITECNADGRVQAKTAYHGIEGGFIVEGSFLYWRPAVDNLFYAFNSRIHFQTDTVNPNNTILFTDADVNEMKFNWEPGFQIGVGYISCCDQWKILLDYTRLKANSRSSSKFTLATGQGTLEPLWCPNFFGDNCQVATAKWNLTFNQVDLTLGRDFFLSQRISLQPYMGLRYASLDQDYHVAYQDATFTVLNQGAVVSVIDDTSGKLQHDFWGIGFLFGTEAFFHLGCGFGIVGNVAGSLLYGKLDLTEKLHGRIEIPTEAGVSFPTVLANIDDDFFTLRGNVEMELGIQWESYWCCDSMRLVLKASYFFANWFNQNNYFNIINSTIGGVAFPGSSDLGDHEVFVRQGGNLNMQGLIIKAGFEF